MIRFFDVIFSFLGLLILLPIMIIVSLMILLESKGGVFYKQLRVGKDNRIFKLYKFRSMTIGSDKKGLITVGSKDSRITKIGYFIRKYKIDELPQLLNVLIGEMSLVGPRPEVKKYVELYTKEEKQVLSVKPGITDYASIEYSEENILLGKSKNPEQTYIKEIIPAKIALNMKYINNKTIIEYFRIIILTIIKILK
ncbi:MAG: sugar transferase [Candidatus Cloacimonetes bacterium]|nr:sugar transferase [Candidatus Cloacimonadota bacterium]